MPDVSKENAPLTIKVKPYIKWQPVKVSNYFNSDTGVPYESYTIVGLCGERPAVKIRYKTDPSSDHCGWIDFLLHSSSELDFGSQHHIIYRGVIVKEGIEGLKRRAEETLSKRFLELDFILVNDTIDTDIIRLNRHSQ